MMKEFVDVFKEIAEKSKDVKSYIPSFFNEKDFKSERGLFEPVPKRKVPEQVELAQKRI